MPSNDSIMTLGLFVAISFRGPLIGAGIDVRWLSQIGYGQPYAGAFLRGTAFTRGAFVALGPTVGSKDSWRSTSPVLALDAGLAGYFMPNTTLLGGHLGGTGMTGLPGVGGGLDMFVGGPIRGAAAQDRPGAWITGGAGLGGFVGAR